MFDDYIKLQAEIVNGKCPTCDEMTILVGLSKEYFRCISCGADLQQHVNGQISYLPTITRKNIMSALIRLFWRWQKVKFTNFVPRPKPQNVLGRHSKSLNKHKKRSYKPYNRQGRKQ